MAKSDYIKAYKKGKAVREQQKKKGGQKPAQQKKSSQKEAEPQNGAGNDEKAADPARARIAAALQKGGIDESVADSVFTLAQSLRGAPAPLLRAAALSGSC